MNNNGTWPRLALGVILTAAAVAGVALGAWLSRDGGQGEPPRLDSATVLPQARALSDFELIDHTEARFDLTRLQGAWTLMFFGFTHCPDVCPTTLSVLDQVQRGVTSASAPLQVVFVSVDPERDRPDHLAAYVRHFNHDFIGVTGKAEQLDRLTRQLGILYLSEQDAQGESTIHHSASILLLDPQGRWRGIFSTPHDPAAISADLQTLLQHYQEG